MLRVLFLSIALIALSLSTRCATINVNVVGWSYLNPSFDTLVAASPGDTLVVFNATVQFVGFFKEVNNVRVDTTIAAPVGDTVDVHVLNWNETTIGYYIYTQVFNEYGLRCTINFLNSGISSPDYAYSINCTEAGMNCAVLQSGVLTIYSSDGVLIAQEFLSPGMNTIQYPSSCGLLIAVITFPDKTRYTQKVVRVARY